jgi:hypothetical protein
VPIVSYVQHVEVGRQPPLVAQGGEEERLSGGGHAALLRPQLLHVGSLCPI